ncbi:MAG: hypothetical protein EXS50_02555 [Candidatus Taylorbacteria bacterium]|nr:hypothetical protein [Candidatus Taylorbacteria bacterium]
MKGQVTLLASSLWLLYYTVLFVSFGVISLYDRMHTYIPIAYLILYCVLTLIMLVMRYIDDSTSSVLLAPVVVSLPFIIMWLVTKGRGLGFGDVVLFLGVGAFFGIEQGFAVLLLSVWMGALVGIYMYLVARKKNTIGKTALPFVPFILLAFLLVLFTDINIFSIANLFA